MKLVKIFSRRLRTARRFVFENIMDLEHVCILHRRWFTALRIHEWRPDYVDYQLRSHFYGISHDIHVRGAPLDRDRYWYEFDGPLARIRVDGRMDGPDGDLILRERITYRFPAALAPAFWLLSPLFQRQKEDILRADSRLLERLYALEQEGFSRSLDTGRPRIVVVGGSGFFGRQVVSDLLERTNASIVIASRNPQFLDFGPHANRVRFHFLAGRDPDAVRRLIRGAAVVVSCVGPYQGQPLTLLQACIDERVHYVDVADDRDFVARAFALQPAIEAAGIMAFVGCSVVPGMSSLLTRYALDEVGEPERVRIFITPGTRFTRGPGSFASLLATIGERYVVPDRGQRRVIRGWTERERVEFPPAVGPRWMYSVVDIADYFTQPHYFATPTVAFKIGCELDALNRCLTLFRLTTQALGLHRTNWLIPLFRAIIRLARPFGTERGALLVETKGYRDDRGHQLALCIFRSEGGEVIPALLPAMATDLILRGEAPWRGIVPLPDWISAPRLAKELAGREVHLVVKHDSSNTWTPFPTPATTEPKLLAGTAP